MITQINTSQKLTDLQNGVLELVGMLDSVSPDEVGRLFNLFRNIPSELQDINKLRAKLRKEKPILFDRNLRVKGELLSFKQQESYKDKILEVHKKKISTFKTLEQIQNYLGNSMKLAESFRDEINRAFPKSEYALSFRLKEPGSIMQNVEWGNPYTLVDVIGLRIVPKDSSQLPYLITKFEKQFSNRLAFKFNIFSYSTDELVNRISKNSIYYRAFHYHLSIDDFFSEVQIRTKGVDQWANLNHDTMYKSKIKITEKQEREVMEFGKMANIVDYADILGVV